MNWGVKMDRVYVGKIVNTHGIKGEIRILSDFPFKDKVFRVGNHLIIDDKEYEIGSYRVHKNFDMVTFLGYNNINDVLFLMKKKVYFSKKDLYLADNEVLDEDLLSFKVLTKDGKVGIIEEIFLASSTNKILRVKFDKEVLIPLHSPMVQRIDKKEKIVEVQLIDGME